MAKKGPSLKADVENHTNVALTRETARPNVDPLKQHRKYLPVHGNSEPTASRCHKKRAFLPQERQQNWL